MKKEKTPALKKVVKIREKYHAVAVRASKADRRGIEVWLENAIIETAERQHDARGSK